MKTLFLVLAAVAFLSCGSKVNDKTLVDVIPFPNDIQLSEGMFSASGAPVTYDPAMDLRSVAVVKSFAEKLSFACGKESVIYEGSSDKGFIFLLNPDIPSEAYILDIKSEKVTVEASGLRGFNYAIQTIKQLLPVEIFGNKKAPRASWTMCCAHIEDSPRFDYRGLLLDEGRHFFGIDQVKRYLDIMEVHKLNKFHWHLTEDQGWRIEIKKYPRLTEVGSIRKGTCIRKNFTSHDGIPYGEGMWYTQEQIREVVEYAASKGIDVIPEIDLPGHMLAALTAYPELGCTGGPYEVWTRWGVSEDVLCAGNEKAYEFLEDVLTEVCELFPYEYIHIGGDECPKVRWEECPKCQAKIASLGLEDKNGHKAEHYLQSYVMARIEKFLNEKGRKIIGWDEILEGEIAPNATIMSWRGEKGGLQATSMGHDAIMTPNTYFYLDYYQSIDVPNEPYGIGGYLPIEKCYSYEPYPKDMTDEQKSHILGVQANLWTEYIADQDHLYYMLLPRLAALAEVQWCNADRKDWNRFYDAADKFCKIYEVMGYNYANHIFQVNGTVTPDEESGKIKVELQTQGNTQIYYTLDGTSPSRRSSKYVEPLEISQTCELRAVTFKDGVEPREFVRRFDFHKASGKKITLSRGPFRRYTIGKIENLVDGIRGPQNIKMNEWVAWHGDPVDITIDLEQTEPYNSVTLGMVSDKPYSVFFPSKLSVSVSDDGENFKEVVAEEYQVEGENDLDVLKDFTLAFPETSSRYVRISVHPVPVIPQWHYVAGGKTRVYIDEIIVR